MYMKKLSQLLCVTLLLFFASFAQCAELIDVNGVAEAQNRINKIGFNILNSNGIEQRTVFDFDTSKTKNAWTRYSDRQITMFRGLYNRLESDDEVAAVLSHEISHSVDSYDGIFRGFFSGWSYAFSPKKYEYKADKRGVDYMVNAGYNPVAMIVVLNKSFPQPRYDWCISHPLISKRMMEVYEYIYNKYPEYLANNTYKNNVYYQNFLLTSKENRAKFRKKIETNSKRPIQYQ